MKYYLIKFLCTKILPIPIILISGILLYWLLKVCHVVPTIKTVVVAFLIPMATRTFEDLNNSWKKHFEND